MASTRNLERLTEMVKAAGGKIEMQKGVLTGVWVSARYPYEPHYASCGFTARGRTEEEAAANVIELIVKARAERAFTNGDPVV